MKKLFILLFACVSVLGRAQAPEVLPQVFSPNAAELGKYGKVPVSYFNGLPNISIPLTELRAKDYTLPIYLTYYAGGNKPDHHPGWVGQGWTLHAGGCINRIIRGQKDEMTKAEFDDNEDRWVRLMIDSYAQIGVTLYEDDVPRKSVSENPGYLYHAYGYQSIKWSSFDWSSPYITEDSLYTFNRYYDYEPDEFQVNLEGLNASFYFTGNGEIRIVSKSDADFTISYTMNTDAKYQGRARILDYKFSRQSIKVYDTFSEFIITTKDGTRYFFGGDKNAIEYSISNKALEYSQRDEEDWDLTAVANTWMLTKIVRSNGEEIKFEYMRGGTPVVEVDSHRFEYAWINNNHYPGIDTFQGYGNISFYSLLPSYLKTIRCELSKEKIVFNACKSTQLDYDYSREVFYKRVGNDSLYTYLIPKQNYHQQLENIESPHGRVFLKYTNNPDTRLKLNAVKIVTGQNDTLRYAMTYDDTKLPRYYSRRTDAWGYYNYDRYYLPAADESKHVPYIANPSLLTAEMLVDVQYPTGGHTCFEYEPHDFSHFVKQFPFSLRDSIGMAGGLRVKRIIDYPVSGHPEERVFSYKRDDGASSGILSGIPKYIAKKGVKLNAIHPSNNTYTWLEHASDSLFFPGQDDVLHYIIFSEHMLNQLSDTDGSHVTYSQVTETILGTGKTVYHYANHDRSVISRQSAVICTKHHVSGYTQQSV